MQSDLTYYLLNSADNLKPNTPYEAVSIKTHNRSHSMTDDESDYEMK